MSSPAHPPLKLLVVIASTRPSRIGLPVGTWIAETARAHGGFDVTVADLKEIDLPMMNEPLHPRLGQYAHEHTKRWSTVVGAQDAFIFVMPEYNHGFTAPLKNAIDYLMQEWQHKPVGVVSYGGVSGGLRAVQQLKQVLSALKMVLVPESVTLPSVADSVSAEGVFAPSDSVTQAAATMLDEVARWSRTLEPLRTGEV